MNGSKPSGPAGIGRTKSRGNSRYATRCSASPHPSPLPWGEGERFSPRGTIQSSRISNARGAPFPLLGERVRVRGNGANDLLAYRTIFGTVEPNKSSGGAGGVLK